MAFCVKNVLYSGAVNRRNEFRGVWRRRGFTLTEMLVVITVIVLIIAMAIPLFRVMSSDRSLESAQNIVSAMLQRARSRAIGLQAARGVFFFEDQATKKTAMIMVRIDDVSGAFGANVIELDEEADEYQTLPIGVGAAFVLGNDPNKGTSISGPTQSVYRPCGLVVFDGLGRIMTVPSFTTYTNDTIRYPKGTRLKDRYESYIGADLMAILGTATTGQQVSQSVIILYDKVTFAGQPAGGSPVFSFTAQQNTWLDNNGLALSVNRYNGTIIRSE